MFSAEDGTFFYRFASSIENPNETTVADLDLDGHAEILGAVAGGVGVFRGAGDPVAVCPLDWPEGEYADQARLAVGNLDNDPEGEFVAQNLVELAVCEADGTRSRVLPLSGVPYSVGLGELDGDALPEIVATYYGDPSLPSGQGIAAFDSDLTLLWAFPITGDVVTFTLADLDADGRHEIVTTADSGLLILGPDGTVRAALPGVQVTGKSLASQVITDVDGDDLAEIVVTGIDPSVVVYTTAGAAGWCRMHRRRCLPTTVSQETVTPTGRFPAANLPIGRWPVTTSGKAWRRAPHRSPISPWTWSRRVRRTRARPAFA